MTFLEKVLKILQKGFCDVRKIFRLSKFVLNIARRTYV